MATSLTERSPDCGILNYVETVMVGNTSHVGVIVHDLMILASLAAKSRPWPYGPPWEPRWILLLEALLGTWLACDKFQVCQRFGSWHFFCYRLSSEAIRVKAGQHLLLTFGICSLTDKFYPWCASSLGFYHQCQNLDDEATILGNAEIPDDVLD